MLFCLLLKVCRALTVAKLLQFVLLVSNRTAQWREVEKAVRRVLRGLPDGPGKEGRLSQDSLLHGLQAAFPQQNQRI